MKGLKDFFYDKNDIFIALAILIIAAGIIAWRMDIIMEYPKTLAAENGADITTSESVSDAQDNSEIWDGGALTGDVTVTVQGGSAQDAVQSLINAGLFQSYDEFAQVCKAAGYTPEHIKATTFTFPSGSTQTDIAKKVTQ